MAPKMVIIDGNEAAAYVAYKTNEVCAIYPITPSSPMGEWADAWSAAGRPNIWGTVPSVIEMQSEGGASGAVHGALQTGSLATTFTASQGLLLMIPNMFKIAGELTPTVFHVAARTVASHALSIFGDQSDVMSTRSTGFAFIASGSIQEVMDFALIAQAASLESRVPFVHFFDGFRSSHEVMKIEQIPDEVMLAMIDEEWIHAHRARALNPDNPIIRGSAQNPDVFFQVRETINPYYQAAPGIIKKTMARFADLTGRQYQLFDYIGDPSADRVVVIMGSGAEAAHETVEYLNNNGDKVGVLKVRLYRPFDGAELVNALPSTTRSLAVMDRTKEPGSLGEPLYLDVVNAFTEAEAENNLPMAQRPQIFGGRYGLSSKEFTPAMVKGIFDELGKPKPKNHFTIGINDDVSHRSLDYDPDFTTEKDDVCRGMFYGLGADGTVGANKNSIKIIGEGTDYYSQGYFVYDSRKAGAQTVSHLRFGPEQIRSTYLIDKANFVACHQYQFLEQFDVLAKAVPEATFLLNSPYPHEEVWDNIPGRVQQAIIDKQIKFYVIDAYKVARETGMGSRINTIMQTCFFVISGVLPKDEAIDRIKESIQKTYGAKGEKIVQMNFRAVDETLAHLHQVEVPTKISKPVEPLKPVPAQAPEFVQQVTAQMLIGEGDSLPVSAFPADGTWMTATTQWEKRNIALEIPEWDEAICIQCNKCALVCPHAVIRMKVYDKAFLDKAPDTFKHTAVRGKGFSENDVYTLQIAPEDCTGCTLCVEACPVKSKTEEGRKAINMVDVLPIREQEKSNFEFFLSLPEFDRTKAEINTVKGSQLLRPLFEFSGACAACGETPYVKLVSQLFGDRAIIANATGCSSIYGGNLPTTPWATDADGRGPTWSNSLFEDNAEFGLGFRLAIDKQNTQAKELLQGLADKVGKKLAEGLINADQTEELGIIEQRERVAELKDKLKKLDTPEANSLSTLADSLVKRSIWIMGGDGWAYDIGYGGLDHVIATGRDVNILVLDTEVYSNTGGQMSKATPMGAVAKFAAGGKPSLKKDLGLMAMTYGNVYVANVAMGAKDVQTLRATIEAESFPGPSLIIAYSHCIAHGIDMAKGLEQQALAVDSGYWPLYRYDPRRADEGKNPLILDSKPPKIPFEEFAYRETRFKMLTKSNPERAKQLLAQAQAGIEQRWRFYENLAQQKIGEGGEQSVREPAPKAANKAVESK
ncbi:MAG: pyruvate:ferredoxin (flavodoxin) oxidoreductase [Fidelibacterota bacterium]|nr:MAG: pyruvate:ferredoxin (flavodoxin) oxidoreductase [Candidatus Neomarinimicrobiota bacterium]